MNLISSAGVRARDFQITLGIKLRTLIRRQKIAQETPCTRFRPILLDQAPIQRTQGAQTRTTADAVASEQNDMLCREGG